MSSAGELTVGQLTSGFGGFAGMKIRRRVNLPVVSLAQDGAEVVCKIIDEIHTGRQIEEGRRGPISKPADVCTVESINGMQGTLIASAVIRRELEEAYGTPVMDEDGNPTGKYKAPFNYVGRWFHIQRTETRVKPGAGGQKYGLYRITELEPPTDDVIEGEAQAAD